jgi:3-oxoacyl-[acyl-carrier-protein] synthase II
MHFNPAHRVVVTGIGLVTPLGADRETTWQRLLTGATATRWLDDAAIIQALPAPIAGAPAARWDADAETARRQDAEVGQEALKSVSVVGEPIVALAVRAAEESLADSQLELAAVDRRRVGCVVGTSKGGLRTFAQAFQARNGRHDGQISPDWWLQFLPNAPAALLANRFDLQGPLLCPVAACATGLTSLARGAGLIRDGHCDVVLAGSTDASLLPAVLASFRRLGVLARGFDDPASACRPFDRHRTGFVIGEGAAVLIFERLEHALARRAHPYAEWLADGAAADVAGMTQVDPSADGLSWLIRDVLRRARLDAKEMSYINLHGTGTVPNDLCETRAVKNAFGRAAHTIRCSSAKGALGHLLGAAGSVETALTLLAMRDGIVPPTANLRDPDPACDLDYTPAKAHPQRIDTALKLSLGFGGHLAAAAMRNLRTSPASR